MMRFFNGYGGYGYNGFGPCGFIGGGFGMMFIGLLIIGLILYLVFKPRLSPVRIESGSDNAIEILNDRFARGEIGEEEYKQKKSLLLKR